MSITFFFAGLFIGVLFGILIAQFISHKKNTLSVQTQNTLIQSEAMAKQKIVLLEDNLTSTNQKLTQANSDVLQLTAKLSTAQSLQQQYEKLLIEMREDRKIQQDYLNDVRRQTKTEFENLANQIFTSKTKTLSEQSEKTLETILKPFQEKLNIFERKVNDVYMTEAKERFALKSEVERLIGLNDRMTQDTKALTQALLGNSKTQGDWGELVLERILEESGLTEGQEYFAQKAHENEDGDRMRPDFQINLPEDKHIIIDSKVSLTSYELYCRSQEGDVKDNALSLHLKSIYKHIDDLANRHYSKLKGVKSPEFVFAFFPIEPAYILAMRSDSELSAKAWRKGVAIVTATTLLTSLKTVASIWQLEKQNHHALEIADEAGKLYDKFCSFLDDFTKIGKTFEMGQAQYSSAMGKLKDGSGNVFRKMETIRMLGASPKHRIKQELLDSADINEPPKKLLEAHEEPEKTLLQS